MSSETSQTYTKVAIWLHWLLAILLIGQFAGGKLMMAMEATPRKFELFQLHKSFGIIILLLSVMRLLWRLTHKAPALPQGMKSFERMAAKLSHWGFYILIIGIPVAGWALVSASTPKITTKIFKTIKWPDLPLSRSEALEATFSNVHEYMAYALALLLVIHIGAALKHHFVDKDDVLTRMVPRLKMKD